MLYYQPLKIKSYKMRLIFIIFIFLMMPACSWLDPNESERIDEIARMLGGIKVTDKAIDHAKEILG